jgi:hypothetical protein
MECSDCRNNIPLSVSRCPHCGRPSLFPNVTAAYSEQSFLQDRYEQAVEKALACGTFSNIIDFEKALDNSRPVINRSTSELQRLIGNEFESYATYYQLAAAAVRIPSGEKWDTHRQIADAIFFTNYQHEIRFASLTLNSTGLSNYGECAWTFKVDMIAHRASLFEENTTLYYLNNYLKKEIKDADGLPKGYRAIWEDRAKLCVAKLAAKIDTTTEPAEYSNILLRQGATSAEDEFVEVHIHGPMTIRTIEEVSFNPIPTTTSKRDRLSRIAIKEGLTEKLRKYGVKVD